jgi:hypothetical protein
VPTRKERTMKTRNENRGQETMRGEKYEDEDKKLPWHHTHIMDILMGAIMKCARLRHWKSKSQVLTNTCVKKARSQGRWTDRDTTM